MRYIGVTLLIVAYLIWTYKSIKEIRIEGFWTKRKPGGFAFWSEPTQGWYSLTIGLSILTVIYIFVEYW